MASLAAARLTDPRIADTPGEFDPLRRVPPGIVRDVMRVAAGASHTGDRLNLDPDLRPQTAAGAWVGGDGPASGPLALDFIESEFGPLEVTYEWQVGSPARPFEPHQDLVEVGSYTAEERYELLAADPSDFPFVAVYAAGDHDGCECEEVLAGLRVSL